DVLAVLDRVGVEEHAPVGRHDRARDRRRIVERAITEATEHGERGRDHDGERKPETFILTHKMMNPSEKFFISRNRARYSPFEIKLKGNVCAAHKTCRLLSGARTGCEI